MPPPRSEADPATTSLECSGGTCAEFAVVEGKGAFVGNNQHPGPEVWLDDGTLLAAGDVFATDPSSRDGLVELPPADGLSTVIETDPDTHDARISQAPVGIPDRGAAVVINLTRAETQDAGTGILGGEFTSKRPARSSAPGFRRTDMM